MIRSSLLASQRLLKCRMSVCLKERTTELVKQRVGSMRAQGQEIDSEIL